MIETIEKIAELTQSNLIEASVEQGHKLTGSLQSRIDYRITTTNDGYSIIITAPKYALYVNFGVSAGKVRYPIRVMVEYWRKRGLPEKEATRAAWATREKHKKEGMPTRASARFSKTGKRTGFISEAVKKSMNQAIDILGGGAADYVRVEIREIFRGELEPVVIEI